MSMIPYGQMTNKQKVFNYLKNNPSATKREIAGHLGITLNQVNKLVSFLKSEGKIREQTFYVPAGEEFLVEYNRKQMQLA